MRVRIVLNVTVDSGRWTPAFMEDKSIGARAQQGMAGAELCRSDRHCPGVTRGSDCVPSYERLLDLSEGDGCAVRTIGGSICAAKHAEQMDERVVVVFAVPRVLRRVSGFGVSSDQSRGNK